MTKRESLSDETIDGLAFGMRLAMNPKVQAQRRAYLERLAKCRAASAHLSKADMIAELVQHNPAYLVKVLERSSEEAIRNRYVHTFASRKPNAP